MNRREKEDIIARLQNPGAGGVSPIVARSSPTACSEDADLKEMLSRMVNVGAARFGVRSDKPAQSGFSACDLAPPLAKLIDHTALKPETTEADIVQLCRDATKYCFASVCVSPSYVALAARELSNSPAAVCTVLGFPHGANRTEVKVKEAELAIRDGATELDMVLNIGNLKSGNHSAVENDIRAVVQQAKRSGRGVLVKVILETALLTDEEKVVASVLAKNAGADFVKTSTGFASGGATAADIALMRRVVGDQMGVKASGGVRSREDAEQMIRHGATRIGASASVAIISGARGTGSY